jgi:biotin-(acetyl-CoA carboxylase) ligase
MPPLSTPQLESLHRLLIDPLRETVRTEIQLGHDRLAASIEKVADHLSTHITTTQESNRIRDTRADHLDRRLALLERFRGKVLVVYAALTLFCTLAWSLLHDYITTLTLHR